jgi:hypothetical protein
MNPGIEGAHRQDTSEGAFGTEWAQNEGGEVVCSSSELGRSPLEDGVELGEDLLHWHPATRIDADLGHEADAADGVGKRIPVGLMVRPWIADHESVDVEEMSDEITDAPPWARGGQ